MTGLPRGADTSRPRDCWQVMVLGGIERLTDALRRGEPFDAQSLSEMNALRMRLSAFDAALSARLRAAEIVMED